jgi:hypothetical protein
MQPKFKVIFSCFLFLILISTSAFAQRPGGDWTLSDTMMYRKKTNNVWKWDSIRYNLYHPPNTAIARGFILSPYTLSERLFLVSIPCRSMVDTVGIGIVYINRAPISVFDTTKGHDTLLFKVLKRIAIQSGHPEYENAPWFTFGHSTGGLLASALPWWKPKRTIGSIVYKSGKIAPPRWLPQSMHDGIAEVPLMGINGQYEEYGPGPSGIIPPGVSHQIQWWSVRDSIMNYRNAQKMYPFSQYVDRNGMHTNWNLRTWEVMARYIQKACQYRLPQQASANGVTTLQIIDQTLACVSDTNLSVLMSGNAISNNRLMSEYCYWPVDSLSNTFFHFDKEMAEAWAAYHYYGPITGLSAQKNSKIRVWPQPAKGQVYFDLTLELGPKIAIQNPIGQTFDLELVRQNNAYVANINQLQPGLYWLSNKPSVRLIIE